MLVIVAHIGRKHKMAFEVNQLLCLWGAHGRRDRYTCFTWCAVTA